MVVRGQARLSSNAPSIWSLRRISVALAANVSTASFAASRSDTGAAGSAATSTRLASTPPPATAAWATPIRVASATGRRATFDAAACTPRVAARRPELAMDITFTVLHSTMYSCVRMTQCFTAVSGCRGAGLRRQPTNGRLYPTADQRSALPGGGWWPVEPTVGRLPAAMQTNVRTAVQGRSGSISP
ncbi:hypothetical protein DX03_12195 [Stenotrophomonas rhizophila]|nr:hypothetical protein DX03_12195 [Stenotrophomonas rhizophila]